REGVLCRPRPYARRHARTLAGGGLLADAPKHPRRSGIVEGLRAGEGQGGGPTAGVARRIPRDREIARLRGAFSRDQSIRSPRLRLVTRLRLASSLPLLLLVPVLPACADDVGSEAESTESDVDSDASTSSEATDSAETSGDGDGD